MYNSFANKRFSVYLAPLRESVLNNVHGVIILISKHSLLSFPTNSVVYSRSIDIDIVDENVHANPDARLQVAYGKSS